ncbi:uncharacterized protein [Chelonus insularis]|uniref:uncharacterized protein isoform X1 n=2 Tax=Chelonus insularis TaxID=460826 RepID=UPI00158BFBDE|nr:uncharacterized protein LOC118064363 isoform X1 [Chelonus insularis]
MGQIAIIIGLLFVIKCFISAESNLIVIEQGDPDDNSKGITYDNLDFLSRFTMNAQYFLPIQWYCPQDCSEFTNSGFMYSTYYTYDKIPDNEKCLGRARQCATHKERSPYLESVSIQHIWNWMVGGFSTESDYYRLKVQQNRKEICPICRCYCDNSEKPSATAAVCLDKISSDVERGYVVTGVRFRIKNRVLRMQIQQGKLIDNQLINQDTLEWQELDDCKSKKNMSYDYRALQTDDITLPNEYFVTGLSFRHDDVYQRIVLSLYGKKLRDLKNTTIKAVEYWRPSDSRTNLITPNMNIPIVSQLKNKELSQPDKNYITFQLPNFSLDIDDDYNELMPFLDIRDVVSDKRPLKGVGIYWRGQEGYGGFVAFKLFAENYTTSINQ